MEADTLINARWVIPIEPAGRVLERHSVVVHQGRIMAVLPTEEAAVRWTAREVIDRPGHVLMPGLVNACADVGTPSATSIAESTAEPWTDPERVRDTFTLALARMLASGTTTFAGSSLFPEILARTAADLHVRACIGLPVLERATAWAATLDEYLGKAAELHDVYSDDPLVTTAFATSEASSLGEGTLQRLRRAADEIELPVFMPLGGAARGKASASPSERILSRLDELGLATPQLVGLGAPPLRPEDLALVARTGMHLIACPRTDVRAGQLSVSPLLDRAVRGGFGTGDHPGLDLQGELQLASLLASREGGVGLDPHLALHRATLGGASAAGLADWTGSLVPGKWADLACINLSTLRTQPVGDVAASLTRLAGPDQVSDTWVAGRAQVLNHAFVRLDLSAVLARASRFVA